MCSFISRRVAGQMYTIEFDPVTYKATGEHDTQLMSYLGYLVHSKVSINENDWSKIDGGVKNVLWQDIQVFFLKPISL